MSAVHADLDTETLVPTRAGLHCSTSGIFFYSTSAGLVCLSFWRACSFDVTGHHFFWPAAVMSMVLLTSGIFTRVAVIREGAIRGKTPTEIQHWWTRPTVLAVVWAYLYVVFGDTGRRLYGALSDADDFQTASGRWSFVAVTVLVMVGGTIRVISIYEVERRLFGYTAALYKAVWFVVLLNAIVGVFQLAGHNWDSGLNDPDNSEVKSHKGDEISTMIIYCSVRLVFSSIWLLFSKHFPGILSRLFMQDERAREGAYMAALLGGEDPDSLLERGTERLRRIPYNRLSLATFQSSESDNKMVQEMSEPCEIGEIDYFISHAWADDPEAKWAALKRVTEGFIQEHGREPYFWLDKVIAPGRVAQRPCLEGELDGSACFAGLYRPEIDW